MPTNDDAAVAYEVFTVDLSVAGTKELQRPGAAVTSVTVLDFPLGGSASLKIGRSGGEVPIVRGLKWTADGCSNERTGIYVVVPSGGAGTASIVVVSGGEASFSIGGN